MRSTANSAYAWQFAEDVAKKIGASEGWVRKAARHGSQSNQITIERRDFEPFDGRRHYHKHLYRVKPPYFGAGIAGDAKWVAVATGLDVAGVESIDEYAESFGVCIERHAGPHGVFFVAYDKKQEVEMSNTNDKLLVTGWMRADGVAAKLGCKPTSVYNAANGERNVFGRYDIEKRDATQAEKDKHGCRKLYRAIDTAAGSTRPPLGISASTKPPRPPAEPKRADTKKAAEGARAGRIVTVSTVVYFAVVLLVLVIFLQYIGVIG